MKVLLLRPTPDPETIGLQHVMVVEPLELEVLGALTEAPFEPIIVDLVLERRTLEHFLHEHRPQVLAVTGYITNVPAMIEACRQAKALDPTVSTVVGGVHCEVCPEDLDHPAVDFRIVRNATRAWPALLTHLQGGGSVPAGVFEQFALPARCIRGGRPVSGRRRTGRRLGYVDAHCPAPPRRLPPAY